MRSVLVLAALAALAATPAAAEVKTFAEAGGWEAFGGLSSDGTPVCGVSTSSDTSFFTLKYFKGDTVLTVQLSDSTWKGKLGDKIPVAMKFDDNPTWRATATTIKLGHDFGLEFTVNAKVIGDWMDEFKESDKLYVVFPDSSVDNWVADLGGTKIIGEQMEKCVGWMTGQ